MGPGGGVEGREGVEFRGNGVGVLGRQRGRGDLVRVVVVQRRGRVGVLLDWVRRLEGPGRERGVEGEFGRRGCVPQVRVCVEDRLARQGFEVGGGVGSPTTGGRDGDGDAREGRIGTTGAGAGGRGEAGGDGLLGKFWWPWLVLSDGTEAVV